MWEAAVAVAQGIFPLFRLCVPCVFCTIPRISRVLIFSSKVSILILQGIRSAVAIAVAWSVPLAGLLVVVVSESFFHELVVLLYPY
jgi:hypothetical protein